MNYLGHIYFSNDNTSLALANLYGDFIKGNKYLEYPSHIQEGILLHRKIDHYIDNHESVRELIKQIRPQLPKVAGIAIDIYFDHLLAKNWNQFHKKSLPNFLSNFYQEINIQQEPYSLEYKQFIELLIERNWLSYYPTEEGLYRMCFGVSQKLSFDNALVQGYKVFKQFENDITSVFHEYMRDADEYFLARF